MARIVLAKAPIDVPITKHVSIPQDKMPTTESLSWFRSNKGPSLLYGQAEAMEYNACDPRVELLQFTRNEVVEPCRKPSITCFEVQPDELGLIDG